MMITFYNNNLETTYNKIHIAIILTERRSWLYIYDLVSRIGSMSRISLE